MSYNVSMRRTNNYTNKRGVAVQKRIPWENIKDDFIKGFRTIDGHSWPSYTELSEKYGVSKGMITSRGVAQGWLAEQRSYIDKFNQIQLDEQGKDLIAHAAEFDRKCFNIANKAIDKLTAKINEEIPVDEDELKILRRIGHLLLTFQKAGQEALGIPKRQGGPTTQINVVSFADGLNSIMQKVKSNPDLLDTIEAEIIDD